jgi:hypothetical protein
MIVRAAVVIFYLVVVSNRSINMQSEQQYERDAKLINAGTCPVCFKTIGKTRSRHAMVQHFYRQKQLDLFHAIYAKTSYKQHFRHGRPKESSPVQPREIAAMLHRHVDKETFETISQMLNK